MAELKSSIAAPVLDVDILSEEIMSDPYPVYDKIRDMGGTVFLTKTGNYFTVDYDLVKQGFGSWQDFSSAQGVGHLGLEERELLREPGLLLENDPPAHGAFRSIIVRLLSPVALRKLRASFEDTARPLVDAAVARGTVDIARDLVRPFILNAIGDAVGLPKEGRENMWHYGAVILATFGPVTHSFERAVAKAREAGSFEWVEQMMRRESLAPGGLGAQIYASVDSGDINEHQAGMLVRVFLGAAVDSTKYTLINGFKNFVDSPAQWALLSHDPTLARDAFEEVVRHRVSVQTLHRVATHDVRFGNVELRAGDRIGLCFAGANRDPARYTDPARFDITRRTAGHMGFGYGIHGCAGQMVARMEAEILLGMLAERVAEIRPAGEPVREVNNSLSSYDQLPVELIQR